MNANAYIGKKEGSRRGVGKLHKDPECKNFKDVARVIPVDSEWYNREWCRDCTGESESVAGSRPDRPHYRAALEADL